MIVARYMGATIVYVFNSPHLFHLSEYLISNHSLRNATHKQSAIVYTGHNSNILPSADLGRIIS